MKTMVKLLTAARDIIFNEDYYSKLGNLDKFRKDDLNHRRIIKCVL